jgi:hypothetical protein
MKALTSVHTPPFARFAKEAEMKLNSKAITAIGVVALALPVAAVAHPGSNHGHHNGQNKPHSVMYIFRGTYAGDGTTVSVTGGNHHSRAAGLVGGDVQFDLSSARISVADTNADTVMDLNDVVSGDSVLVQARLPKGDPGAQPLVARQLVDQTNSAVDDESTDTDDDSADDPTDD